MPTYKAKKVIADLERLGCEQVKSNGGSHQKIRNPAANKTTVVAVHKGKDLTQEYVKDVYKQLGLKFEK